MESRTKRFVIGIALVLAAAALVYGGYRLLYDNIPEPGLETGAGTIADFVPPFPHAMTLILAMFLLAFLAMFSGIMLMLNIPCYSRLSDKAIMMGGRGGGRS